MATTYYSHYGFPPVAPPAPDIVSWLQKTLNTVEVVLEDEPKHIDPSAPGDCLNLDNYIIIGPTTPYPERLVQYVEYLGDNTVRIWFDGELVPEEIYTIEIYNLETEAGAAFASPMSASFTAFGADRPVIPLRLEKVESWDIANPQIDRDSQGWSLGTMGVDGEGDIAVESRRPALRKRILRRCTSKPGAYVHLSDYGLKPGEKKLIRPTELRRLQQDAEAQVSQEPDVVSVRAIVSQPTPGVVWLTLKVKDRQGWFNLEALLRNNE